MFEMKPVTKIFNKFQLNYFQSQMKAKRQIRGKSLQGTPYFISEDEKLGTGSYGSVYKAYNRQNPNEELVVKVISILDEDNEQSVQAELEVIRELPRHQNLVNCVKAHIASQKNLYIVMEYCNQGSLSKYIEKMALMSEEKIWDFIVQIAKGYQVLHDANLLHRDIKPDNILIHNKIFKLADFGLAKHIQDHTIKQNLSYAGSPLYIAPQITENNIGSSKVDVFSLGSVLYQLAYDGTQPFYRQSDNYKNPQEYYKKRKTMKLTLKPRNKKGEIRSQQLRNLLQRMLEFDQEKRISWEQIFGHPRIDINKMKPKLALRRIISHQEEELEALRRSLIEVSRSSAKIEPITEKENARQQSQEMTLELIDFEQFLQHKELRNLEQEMFRLKITQLTIIYCTGKITYIVKDNLKHKSIHNHIIQCLQNLVIEGLLYLLKINDVINTKIGVVQEKVVKQLISILVIDKEKLVAEFKKEVEIFKNVMEYQKELQQIKSYDLRRYQSQLYNFLTQYCDYPSETKQKLSVIVSILIDVYDSSLKLSEMVQKDKIVWDKYQDMNQIQTQMDEICYNKLEPHEFHTYLMKKEHVKLQEINSALQKVGLLFA